MILLAILPRGMTLGRERARRRRHVELLFERTSIVKRPRAAYREVSRSIDVPRSPRVSATTTALFISCRRRCALRRRDRDSPATRVTTYNRAAVS